MLVKRVSGLELGGGVAPPVAESGQRVAAGDRRRVRFELDCHLNTGVYFLNCGVTGNGGDQLHRIVDAVIFRVMPIVDATVFGPVNFGCRPVVEVLGEVGPDAADAPNGDRATGGSS
jgi:lipopolysaccharide transport system ATP-binding protein